MYLIYRFKYDIYIYIRYIYNLLKEIAAYALIILFHRVSGLLKISYKVFLLEDILPNYSNIFLNGPVRGHVKVHLIKIKHELSQLNSR